MGKCKWPTWWSLEGGECLVISMPVSGHVCHWSPVCGTYQMDELAREGQIRQVTSVCGRHSRPRARARNLVQEKSSSACALQLDWQVCCGVCCLTWVAHDESLDGIFFSRTQSSVSHPSSEWHSRDWTAQCDAQRGLENTELQESSCPCRFQMQRTVSLPGLFSKRIRDVVLRSAAHWTREIESCSCVILLQNRYSEQKGR